MSLFLPRPSPLSASARFIARFSCRISFQARGFRWGRHRGGIAIVLGVASAALSQLSYIPVLIMSALRLAIIACAVRAAIVPLAVEAWERLFQFGEDEVLVRALRLLEFGLDEIEVLFGHCHHDVLRSLRCE